MGNSTKLRRLSKTLGWLCLIAALGTYGDPIRQTFKSERPASVKEAFSNVMDHAKEQPTSMQLTRFGLLLGGLILVKKRR